MKRIVTNPQLENLIDELETSLANIYGSEFVIDLQEICGQHTLKSVFGKDKEKTENRVKYSNMLRGAWYAAHQNKVVK